MSSHLCQRTARTTRCVIMSNRSSDMWYFSCLRLTENVPLWKDRMSRLAVKPYESAYRPTTACGQRIASSTRQNINWMQLGKLMQWKPRIFEVSRFINRSFHTCYFHVRLMLMYSVVQLLMSVCYSCILILYFVYDFNNNNKKSVFLYGNYSFYKTCLACHPRHRLRCATCPGLPRPILHFNWSISFRVYTSITYNSDRRSGVLAGKMLALNWFIRELKNQQSKSLFLSDRTARASLCFYVDCAGCIWAAMPAVKVDWF